MKISKRSKVEAGIIALIVCLACVASVMSTRTITDSSDSIYTQIITSSVGVFPATAAGLRQALALGGTIQLPAYCNITITTASLNMTVDYTKLYGHNATLYLAPGANWRNMLNVTASHCLIDGIRFDVNNISQTVIPTQISAIDLKGGSYNTTIQNCYFYRGEYSLILTVAENTGNHVIQNNWIDGKQRTGYGAGITIRCSGNIIQNNHIKDGWAAGIVLEGSTALTRYNIVQNNIIWGNVSYGIYMEPGAAEHTSITDNIIYNFNGSAYYATSGYYSTGILGYGNVTIARNKIYGAYHFGVYYNGNNASESIVNDNNINVVNGPGFVSFYGKIINLHDNIINSAKTTTAYPCAVYIRGSTKVVSDVKISHNVINCSNLVGIYVTNPKSVVSIDHNTIINSTDGIDMYSTWGYNKIDNNRIYNYTGIGIKIGDSTHISHNNTVNDNTLVGIGGAGTYGISFSKACSNNTCKGNIIKGVAAHTGIYETAVAPVSDFNHIYMNDLKGCSTPLSLQGAHTVALFNDGSYSTIPLINMTAYGVRAGFMWYSIAANAMYIYDGTAWDTVAFT